MTRPRERLRRLLLSGLLLLLTGLVYARALTFDFVNFDDDVYVTKNPAVRSGLTTDGLAWALTTNHAANWHPLTWLSLMLDAEIAGLRPGMFHLTNVLLHAANVLLLFLVLSRMTRSTAKSAFVAALFAVHPLHVESVAWIAERKDVLSTLFWLLTLLAYHSYVREPVRSRGLLVAGTFALGLMAKPMLVTLPLVLLLLDLWPLGRCDGAGKTWPVLVREKAPLFALSAASAAITWVAQERGGAFEAGARLSLPARAAGALVAQVAYARKMLWPRGLAVFYPRPGDPLPIGEVRGSALLLALATFFALRAARRRPYVTVGWFWYSITLLPVLGLVQVGRQSMADRYTYVPMIGLFVLVTWGAADLLEFLPGLEPNVRRVLLVGSGSVAVAALAIVASIQADTWRDSRTLFEHALAVTSRNYLAESALGSELAREGELDRALAHFREALRIEPGFVEARNALALALLKQGKVDDAVAEWTEALRTKPDYAEARANLAAARLAQGKPDETVAESRRALSQAPGLPRAHTNLGLVLLREGRFEDAASEFRAALAADPDHAPAHVYLAGILLKGGRTEEAVRHCTEALRLDPTAPGARHNLGLAFLQEGRLDEAREQFEAAVRTEPRYLDSRLNLGVVLARQGHLDEAVAEFREVLRIDPGNETARRNLASLAGPPAPRP